MAKDESGDIKLAVFAIVFGGGLVWNGIARYRRTRKTQDTAHIDIASAPQGLVEIQGFAWPKQGASLTLAGRQAVYHRLVLQKEVRRDKRTSWQEQWSFTLEKPFYILDRSGLAEICAKDAELEVRQKTHAWKSLSAASQKHLENFRINVASFPPSRGLLGLGWSPKFRLLETAILVGSPLYTHGTFATKTEKIELPPTLALKRFRKFISHLKGRKLARAMHMDANRDGVVCEDEAIRFANSVSEESIKAKPNQWDAPAILPGETLKENTVFGTVGSCSERKLYIADCHEDHLIKRIGNNNILRIVSGALLIGAGVGYLTWRAGFR